MLSVELEMLERKFALAGEADADDLDLYVRASGGLRRLLEGVGIKRVAREVPSSLSALLRSELQDVVKESSAA